MIAHVGEKRLGLGLVLVVGGPSWPQWIYVDL